MRLKQIFTTLLLAGVLVFSTTACGNTTTGNNSNSGTSTVSQASQSDSGSTIGTQYSTDNDTKVKQMLDKVTFNGKPLKIPYKASDLGEGFTFDSDVGIYGDNDEYAIATIKYNGVFGPTANLQDYNSSQKPEDFVAYTISYSLLLDDMFKDMLQIDGIGASNTLDDVISKFGEPTLKEEYSKGYALYYRIGDISDIMFCSDEKNNIISIDIQNQ